MPHFLEHRAENLTELMDDPNCDREKLFNTYDQFSKVNDLISRWESIFLAYIAPLATKDRELRILDIGCGGGDLCLKFAQWAEKENIRVHVTGIDPDPRAMEYIDTLELPDNVEFKQSSSSYLIQYGDIYDVVTSNHLIHHLTGTQIADLCRDAEKLARKLVIFNDIRRSKTGFTAFGLIAPLLFSSSYIVRDGLTSIRRSFKKHELLPFLPHGWTIKKLMLYRLLILFEKN